MCSKSVSSSTCRVPPFLPPVSDCVVGLWNPPVLTVLEPLEPELEDLLEPHAASTTASTATAAIAPTVLIDLIESTPGSRVECPSSGTPRAHCVSNPVP